MFTLRIETDNAAFGDGESYERHSRSEEIKRILRELIRSAELDGIIAGDAGDLRDANGNKVGTWRLGA